MGYSKEGYISSHRDSERVASMVRAIVQEGTKKFKTDGIDPFYKKKMVNGVDIGPICSNLQLLIMGSLKGSDSKVDSPEERETLQELINLVYIYYLDGINPYEDEAFGFHWQEISYPLFSNKINSFPATGKASPMANLDKPSGDKRRDVKTVNW